jgi:hypothetical protein
VSANYSHLGYYCRLLFALKDNAIVYLGFNICQYDKKKGGREFQPVFYTSEKEIQAYSWIV